MGFIQAARMTVNNRLCNPAFFDMFLRGRLYIISSITCSRMARRPRAPVFFFTRQACPSAQARSGGTNPAPTASDRSIASTGQPHPGPGPNCAVPDRANAVCEPNAPIPARPARLGPGPRCAVAESRLAAATAARIGSTSRCRSSGRARAVSRVRPSAAMRSSSGDPAASAGPGGQHGPARARERDDPRGVLLPGHVAEPVRVVERLKRAAAALRERQCRVDEREREAADRDRRPRGTRSRVSRRSTGNTAGTSGAACVQPAARAVADVSWWPTAISTSSKSRCEAGLLLDLPAVCALADVGLRTVQSHLDVRRRAAQQRLQPVAEIAAHLGAGRIVLLAATARGSPLDERRTARTGRRPARRPPEVERGGREVHAQVVRLIRVVDRARARRGVRLEDVDLEARARWEVARVVEQALEREQALRAEAGDCDAPDYRSVGIDAISPSATSAASRACGQPSSRSTQASS